MFIGNIMRISQRPWVSRLPFGTLEGSKSTRMARWGWVRVNLMPTFSARECSFGREGDGASAVVGGRATQHSKHGDGSQGTYLEDSTC